MPGINLVYKQSGIDTTEFPRIEQAVRRMETAEGSRSEVIFRDSNFILTVSYPFAGYPFRHFTSGDLRIFIEGYIYGKNDSEIKKQADDISELIRRDAARAREEIRRFLMEADGEFIIAIYDTKACSLLIMNDILARLPTYFSSQRGAFYLSRELKFIANLIPKVTLSAHSAAQSMVFLFPLGHDTLIREIKKMPPATLFTIGQDNDFAGQQEIYDWNLSTDQVDARAADYADEMIPAFIEGTAKRYENFKDRTNIIALSGGLDSRTVLAGLEKVSAEIMPVSFIDHLAYHRDDFVVAEKLAAVYGLSIHQFSLPGINLDDIDRLIRMKDGHSNNGIMGTVLESHRIIVREYGNEIAYYTGAGGGLILGPRCPISAIENFDELQEQIVTRNAQISMEVASGILKIDAKEIKNRARTHFRGYPEETLKDKYGHFMIFEHLLNFSYQGEDREKFYFWNPAPLYCVPFFLKAMRLSDASKMNHVLFAEFLKKIDPRIAAIKYANWGIPVTSPLVPAYLALKNWLLERPGLANIIRKIRAYRRLAQRKTTFSSIDNDARILRENIKNVIANSPGLREYIATDTILELLPKINRIYDLYVITNLATYVRNLLESRPTLTIDSDK